MHNSVKMDTPCEIINVVPCNPLISKCQIKVCYVGDEPNRNRSVITKDVAREMANSLPGSPIVGFFNESTEDFEEHNRAIDIINGQFKIKDTTRPYGFVDLGAKCWFQKFKDDGVNEHEYLMTEGYIWTGQYPESKRIIEHGNNQSMELDENSLNAAWTKDNNGKPQFFIINEAIISKLCILGEEYEPCFEGSSITKVQFSFEDGFKEQLFSMINEVKELLNKGGAQVFTTYAVKVGDSLWTALYSFVQEREYASIEAVLEDGERKFAVIKDNAENVYSLDFSIAEDGSIQFAEEAVAMEEYTPTEEPQFALADIEAFEAEYKKADKKEEEEDKKDESDTSESENKTEDEKSEEGADDSDKKDEESDDKDKDDEEDKKKNKYNLEEIPEYTNLFSEFSELQKKYNDLVVEKNNLESQMVSLVEFKNQSERKEKEYMINTTFFMLSDEDKKDVIENIDTYSLEDIEAKLSIICFRNKVNFATLEDNADNEENPIVYNIGSSFSENESTPAWVKAVLKTAETLN